MRGATTPTKKSRIRTAFQSTLLMRGATASAEYANIYVDISIHAPHARSDSGHPQNRQLQHISIHAPHARSDATVADVAVYYKTFQSTLLMRGATGLNSQNRGKQCHFNPRSSCEERRASQRTTTSARYFNPRSSCEERRDERAREAKLLVISIHAPHARSDGCMSGCWPGKHRFQSTLLMRGATRLARQSCNISQFQSTLLMRGATSADECIWWIVPFQSTLLMRGATRLRSCASISNRNFNPRSSCEERLQAQEAPANQVNFNPRSSCEERLHQPLDKGQRTISIHAPHARSDDALRGFLQRVDISIHAPHARSDLVESLDQLVKTDFNPRSSCEERRGSRDCVACGRNFNPRSSCEERLKHIELSDDYPKFQSTLLMRGATHTVLHPHQYGFISIHAPHARSDLTSATGKLDEHISIHAPHARSDVLDVCLRRDKAISIHAPHARSDVKATKAFTDWLFQSTLLMRGATALLLCRCTEAVISIHAPHARSDV